MYSQHKVVLVETRDPKSSHEVTGLGSVALPCQQQLGNLLSEKAHVYFHLPAWTIVLPENLWNPKPEYLDGTVCKQHTSNWFCLCIKGCPSIICDGLHLV